VESFVAFNKDGMCCEEISWYHVQAYCRIEGATRNFVAALEESYVEYNLRAKNVAGEQYIELPTSALHTWGPGGPPTGNMDAGTSSAGNNHLLRRTRPRTLNSCSYYRKPIQ
jgi:hypothetical protein